MNNQAHTQVRSRSYLGSMILSVFVLLSMGGCCENQYSYRPTDEVITLSRSMCTEDAICIVEKHINADPIHRLKLLSLREPGKGVYAGVDHLTRIHADEKSFTFLNTFYQEEEISHEDHMKYYVSDLKEMLMQGEVDTKEIKFFVKNEQEGISEKKAYKKTRKNPITIDYGEISVLWVNRYCKTKNRSIFLSKSICGKKPASPRTFFLICVPEDQFDDLLSALIFLLPHAVLKEEKSFEEIHYKDSPSC